MRLGAHELRQRSMCHGGVQLKLLLLQPMKGASKPPVHSGGIEVENVQASLAGSIFSDAVFLGPPCCCSLRREGRELHVSVLVLFRVAFVMRGANR
jgi:hypothetical protein